MNNTPPSNLTPALFEQQAELLAECRKALECLLAEYPTFTGKSFGLPYGSTYGNLRAGLFKYRDIPYIPIATAQEMLRLLQHFVNDVAGADDQTLLLFENRVRGLLEKVVA